MSWYWFYARTIAVTGVLSLVGVWFTFWLIGRYAPEDDYRRFALIAMPASVILGALVLIGAVVTGLIWPPGWL